MRRPIYRLMKRIATRALIELTPETGRRNQIRVHLADAECTIIGDRKYAARTNPARRLGLQQWQATHRTVVTERLTHVFWGNEVLGQSKSVRSFGRMATKIWARARK